MNESFTFIASIAPTLLAAVPMTLVLTFLSSVIGNSLAVPIAMGPR